MQLQIEISNVPREEIFYAIIHKFGAKQLAESHQNYTVNCDEEEYRLYTFSNVGLSTFPVFLNQSNDNQLFGCYYKSWNLCLQLMYWKKNLKTKWKWEIKTEKVKQYRFVRWLEMLINHLEPSWKFK